MTFSGPCRSGVALLGVITLVGGLSAQTKAFAAPWQIDLARIKTAMESRALRITQVRRVWEERAVANSDPTKSQMELKRSLVGTRELLLLSPQSGSGSPRFSLSLLGLEHQQMTASALQVKRREFDQNERTLFRHHGFRVIDPRQAAANYAVYYMGKVTRIGHACYRVVVLPRSWDRSAWLLDLDRETGYPLYQGEYSLSAQLLGEIQVEKFELDPDFHAEQENDTHGGPVKWSQTRGKVQSLPSPALALKLALAGRSQVAPEKTSLPQGFSFREARVLKGNFLTGSKTSSAVLVYSDGLTSLFCLQRSVARRAGVGPEKEHRMMTYNTLGFSECLFSHAGVEFRVMGAASRQLVSGFGQALYRTAVRTMK